ncbi:N-acyl-phosphatidylethanolamine-hydrolyzing phospholipase D [Aaosphaeria arxii CBS 175.79]|uniref:N-acyl-phosphatidylethanolamine-hydrolyzing phospholipase D n=1 Tax=Aaosphaeria arxii CBS 175.79 TaxID=1450172 RepID=A0A6A5Y227_9PLEO|nr:N-acyl-phosphatidylethanolamine-hydrolyzing phospholipase D [Aaosphaeria arxii CBS 175.79]KAF2019562.1 N-acyl-phosphatidylethanolamine-hydrolyzing phospholipase D [Aaosphaeria arxii CBS 175.79]
MSSASKIGVGSATLYAIASMAPSLTYSQPEEAENKTHHLKNGKGFVNPWDSFRDFTPISIMKAMVWRKLSGQSNTPDTTPPTVPIVKPNFLPSRETAHLRATWLGHACYYVEFPGRNGLRVLFDPVFEDCCAPINLPNLKRYTPPPCEIEELPVVDAVVISHNHYDHLSYPTINRIKEKFPNAHFFAPLGNKKWFVDTAKVAPEKVTELDWWEARDLELQVVKSIANEEQVARVSVSESSDGAAAPAAVAPAPPAGEKEDIIKATISALPCQHVSARTPFDKCRTLWASWSVESGGAKVYFAGDTGYRSVPQVPAGEDDYSPKYAHLPTCPAFQEIGQHRGPFDLGLIPIGAYAPRFIMSPMHANPKDAVNIFRDTRCEKALGMHWGTWVLTEEDVLEPPRLLKEALKWKGLEETGVFDVVDIGESREFKRGEGKEEK